MAMHRPAVESLPPHPVTGEHVWSLRKAGREIDCELHANWRGAWDCRLFDGDWLIASRRSSCRADALAYAEQQRQALVADGWATD
jgi:hypothetical protein